MSNVVKCFWDTLELPPNMAVYVHSVYSHLVGSAGTSPTRCDLTETDRSEYWELGVFLLQYFPLVKICKLMHFNCINMNIVG